MKKIHTTFPGNKSNRFLEVEQRMLRKEGTPDSSAGGGDDADEDAKKLAAAKAAANAQQPKPTQQEKAPAPRKPERDPHDLPSIRDITRNYVRPKLFKAIMIGSALAFPALGVAAVAGDFAARNTIGKIPVVKEVYDKPRKAIIDTAKWTSDRIGDVLTLPAAIPDAIENVAEGLSGNTQVESKGVFGRVMEKTFESIGWVGRGVAKTPGILSKGLGTIFKNLKMEHILSAPGKVIDAYAQAWANRPLATLIAHAVGGGMIGAYGFGGAGLQVWNVIQHIGNGLGTWMGAPAIPIP